MIAVLIFRQLLIFEGSCYASGFSNDQQPPPAIADGYTISGMPWFRELSDITNDVSVPLSTGHKIEDPIRASAMSRSSIDARCRFDKLMDDCEDQEMIQVYKAYKMERDSFDE